MGKALGEGLGLLCAPFTSLSLSPLSLSLCLSYLSLPLYISPSTFLFLSLLLFVFSLSFSLAYLMDVFVLVHKISYVHKGNFMLYRDFVIFFLKQTFSPNYNFDLRSYRQFLSLLFFITFGSDVMCKKKFRYLCFTLKLCQN